MLNFTETLIAYMVPVEVEALFFATAHVFDALCVLILKTAAGAAGCRVEGVPYGITVCTPPVCAAVGFPAAFGT